MKPSVISKIHPWSSVMQNCECEIVATNIMKILARTGDTFRELTAEEYEAERNKDFAENPKAQKPGYMEMETFDRVKNCAKSVIMAANFCKGWAEALDAASVTA